MKVRKLCAVLCTAAALTLSPLARGDVITDWNLIAMDATAGPPTPVQGRILSIAHGAMFDAANAIERRYTPYLAEFKAPTGASVIAAVAAAGHGVLAGLVPGQKAMLDGALATTLSKIADGASKEDGLALGREVAQAYIAVRSNDGIGAKDQHMPGAGMGQWQPTPPAHAPMALPHLANVLPFTAKSFDFLDVKGPPPLDSAANARDLDEVRRVGARNSNVRTADQTASAIFWVINTTVPWNAAARSAAQKAGTSVVDNARVFALMNMAGEDAYIAGWQIKRKTSFWRPVTAIRNAASNPDPVWDPLLITPAHPDYPSGHTIYSGAAAGVLQRLFNTDQVAFSATFGGPNGVIRGWRSLSEAEKDVQGARIWAGIHFRIASEQGGQLGHAIADRAVETLMRPIQ